MQGATASFELQQVHHDYGSGGQGHERFDLFRRGFHGIDFYRVGIRALADSKPGQCSQPGGGSAFSEKMSPVKGIVFITHAESSYLFANAKPVFSISPSVIATGTVKLIFFQISF